MPAAILRPLHSSSIFGARMWVILAIGIAKIAEARWAEPAAYGHRLTQRGIRL